MNNLTAEMRRSLKELDLGLKGELTITSDMEDLSNALFFDQVGHFKKWKVANQRAELDNNPSTVGSLLTTHLYIKPILKGLQ